MKELVIEKELVSLADQAGGIAPKWGWQGWPDRMILLPGGRAGFVELKRPGERPSTLQLKRLGLLASLGFHAQLADSIAEVRRFVRSLGPGVVCAT